MVYIYPQAEPFFLQGKNDRALLFIHGFTASPSEVLPTAKLIHKMAGYSVQGLLLPGHGSNPKNLQETSWEEWFGAVEEAVKNLIASYEHVFVAGLSLGAFLALYAAEKIQGINGVISINAPIFSHFPLLAASAPLMMVLKPYFPKKDRIRFKELEEQGRFAYEVTPVKAFQSMLNLRQELINQLDQINVPVLVMQSQRDETAHPRSADYLVESIGEQQARKVELPESEHVATMGPETERIADEMLAFMDDCSNHERIQEKVLLK